MISPSVPVPLGCCRPASEPMARCPAAARRQAPRPGAALEPGDAANPEPDPSQRPARRASVSGLDTKRRLPALVSLISSLFSAGLCSALSSRPLPAAEAGADAGLCSSLAAAGPPHPHSSSGPVDTPRESAGRWETSVFCDAAEWSVDIPCRVIPAAKNTAV